MTTNTALDSTLMLVTACRANRDAAAHALYGQGTLVYKSISNTAATPHMSIYFCNPGELVVFASSKTPSAVDGQLARVLGIKKGRVEVELQGQQPLPASRLLADPADLIDASECGEEEDEDEADVQIEGEGESDSEMDEAEMDQFIDSVLQGRAVAEAAAAGGHLSLSTPPIAEDVVWKSVNAQWKEIVAKGHSILISAAEAGEQQMLQIAQEAFHNAIFAASTRDEKLVSLLMAIEGAFKLENVDLLLNYFNEYLTLNPKDIFTRLRQCTVLWESSKFEKAEFELSLASQQFPTSSYVWFHIAKYHFFRGNKEAFVIAIKKCCYECPLQSEVERNFALSIETYINIAKLGMQILDIDPWLSIRAFVRALNVARTNGLDPSNPRSMRSNKNGEATARQLLSKCLYEFAEVLKAVGEYLNSRNRVNGCIKSAYSVLSMCIAIDGSSPVYRQAKNDCGAILGLNPR